MSHDVQRTFGDGGALIIHFHKEDALLVAQWAGDDLAPWRDHERIAAIGPRLRVGK